MTSYAPPLRDIRFTLTAVAGLEALTALPGYEEATPELCDHILEEAAKIAAETLAPLNRIGDTQGSRWSDGAVTTPDGWKDAWSTLVAGGWNGLPFDAEWGGMGLPGLLNTAVSEMWQSANMAFALCPMLTQGAVNALEKFGSDQLKATYLPKMTSGEWTGAMDLTEPQAGSDLAAIRSKAEPAGDGSYKVFGQKIFITYGDHDLAENIIHLVLARLSDAPPGVKGLSLFVVPKFLVDANGAVGARNDVKCVSLEHKLGIHGSPTAVLAFGDEGGAVGWLVGEAHRGLEYMFVMMNHARQQVGLQGLAIAERAYQQALTYARERVQGVPAGWTAATPVGIVRHPDVRRMLMTMKARIEAMRGVLYVASSAHDRRHAAPDEAARTAAATLDELLTPIAKGWCTETGLDVASDGLQIHGGMGYIEETGAAQHLRDARITTIYEGATAIQANDLVNRKLLRDNGAGVTCFLDAVRSQAAGLLNAANPHLRMIGGGLIAAAQSAADCAAWIVARADDPAIPAVSAVPFLHVMGLVAGGHYLAVGAETAVTRLTAGESDDGFLAAKPITAAVFVGQVLPQADALRSAIINGSNDLMALRDDQM